MNDNVPMPERIAALERDARGYPIPHIIMRDENGTPMFTVNDKLTVLQATKDNLCHICGQKNDQYSWFVGGPGSYFLNGNHAAYFDGPMHQECMEFAMQVCPHLAHRIRGSNISEAIRPHVEAKGIATESPESIFNDTTPEVFVAVSGWKWDFIPVIKQFIIPLPARKVQFWMDGQLMPRNEGEKVAKKAAREMRIKLGR